MGPGRLSLIREDAGESIYSKDDSFDGDMVRINTDSFGAVGPIDHV